MCFLSGSSSMTMEDMPEPPIIPNFETCYLTHEELRKIINFKKDLPSEVSYRRPWLKRHLWAFWSEPTLSPCSGGSITDSATHPPTANQPIITDIIKSALLHFHPSYSIYDDFLIQFWAPITTETGCVQLVTSDQPFALTYNLDEGLLKYRKQCLQYKFDVDGEQVEGLGIPGRVFRQKWHEYLPHVRHYSTKEYPQRDFALACHISKSFCCPLFQTSFQGCVGVLEFVATNIISFYSTCKSFIKLLAGLKTSFCDGLICKVFSRFHPNIRAEIKEGLKVVCKTHDLPLAMTRIPCGHFNGNLDNSNDTFDVSCMGPAFHYKYEASYFIDDILVELFYDRNDFQNGQEVVRSAYQSHKLCLCRDLTQFSITEYPDLPLARAFGLTSCFFICLQSTRAKNYHYVLEFFLNPKNTYGEDPSTFLCPILETMKQHFPSFKLASGEELGKELPIEVIKPRMNQEPASFQCQSTLSPSRPGVLHNAQEMMQPHSSNQQMLVEVEDINYEWNLVNDEQNNIPVSCSNEDRMNQELATFQCQSTISPPELEVLHNGQETTQPHPPNQQLIIELRDTNNGMNVVNAEPNGIPVSCSDEAINSITYEEIKKHFGKKLEDVAQIFDVSRSTFKRICRKNGIHRWKRGKRNKVKGSPSRQDPSCSHLPAEKLVATVAHLTPLPTTQEVRAITIKAKFGGCTIKFQLPSTSGMVELGEEVLKRLKLDVGTYNITYNDGEDQILIACDEDWRDCMSASDSMGTIRLVIEPITQISPSM
ncbi:protein NLP3-like [Cornus florida]|uniref:protein NLP3-like n=1 Tax=Cornus florida TaxID=4283 RepID=UPI00289D850B|nr:protein NLP3-like [Cornus florida]